MILVVLGLFVWSIIKHGFNSPNIGPITPTEVMKVTASHLPPLGTQADPNQIHVVAPSAGDVVSSPIEVSGQALGNWFFEAQAPVSVLDLNGALLGRGTIRTSDDWSSGELVNFSGSINFTLTTGSTAGVLLLENDNPSGQASTSRYLAVPIVFAN
jgi:Immunoglobulin-like domain of bacterial spore germination